MIFMILGLSILNYGTKLETAVSANMAKSQNSKLSSQLSGLDIRILTITILLSLIFMCRAIIDSIYAWSLLNANLQYPQLGLILIFFTEISPSIIIIQIMKKKQEPKLHNQGEVLAYESHKIKIPKKGKRLIQSPSNRRHCEDKQTDEELKNLNQYFTSDDQSEEDSVFGSFNPNLNTKHEDDEDDSHIMNYQNEKGTTYENMSKFTTKTSSYKGLLMLEKAPDESLLQKNNRGQQKGRSIRIPARDRRMTYDQQNKSARPILGQEAIHGNQDSFINGSESDNSHMN